MTLRILAIDTALGACATAIAAGEDVRALRSEPMARGHAERLAPLVAELMADAGLAFADLDRIVVTTGPGSFTGVRVGLSFARALALALDRPCIGVGSLEAFALEAGEEGLRGAAIPAPSGVYAAIYRTGAALVAPALFENGAAAALAGHGASWRGPAAAAFGGAPSETIDIAALARRAARLDPGRFPPAPMYLRAPDARLPAGASAP